MKHHVNQLKSDARPFNFSISNTCDFILNISLDSGSALLIFPSGSKKLSPLIGIKNCKRWNLGMCSTVFLRLAWRVRDVGIVGRVQHIGVVRV